MSDINAVVVVSFVKHFDNDTKGTMEFGDSSIGWAVEQAQAQLISDAIDDGIDVDKFSPAELFTITKAAFGVPTNWIGV